jgi:nitric oxide reductase subunit C
VGVNMVGPTLAGIAATAATRVAATDYTGQATDAAGYIRESILLPNAALVPGATYSANGKSLMPPGFDQTLQPAEVDALVAYLMTLE